MKLKVLSDFLSDDFDFWQPKLNGEELMQAVKDEVIEFNYDLEALYKSHRNDDIEEDEAC